MRVIDILAKKRDGRALSSEEIEFLVNGYIVGDVPDYQMSAFLMAAFLRGMTEQETFALTKVMIDSGETIDLSGIEGIKVDKHSTGGVGDKVTLALAPMMAAVGLKVAKMSGRGLGHTGGTTDKLESIPGFRTDLSMEEFVRQVNDIGLAVMGQTEEVCLADKKIYALRDATGTVASMPLIASSVMSKKIAGGADVIVLDVKAGSGAFMKTIDEARALASQLVAIGKHFGKKTVAVVSNMDQPLGSTVGNALEVEEAIDLLRGFGPPDLLSLCYTLGSQLMVKAGLYQTVDEAMERLDGVIQNGEALAKFREFVVAQGGDPGVVDDPRGILPHARYIDEIPVAVDGYIRSINAEHIGVGARYLGAGRQKIGDQIDPTAGLFILHKIGDYVRAGDTLVQMHGNDPHNFNSVRFLIEEAFQIVSSPHEAPETVYDIIE